jgi:hypothetical protein
MACFFIWLELNNFCTGIDHISEDFPFYLNEVFFFGVHSIFFFLFLFKIEKTVLPNRAF